MTRERAKSMDQRSFWMVDAAGAPGKLRRPPMASPEPGRMLAFAPFQGFIRGMSGYIPLTLWRHMTNSMIMIFRRSSALLYHRSISLFDIMLAKFALEFIATSGAFLAVWGTLNLVGVAGDITRFDLLFVGCLMMGWLPPRQLRTSPQRPNTRNI